MKYEGSCHCGNVAFEVEGEFDSGLDCNCSLCRRRGGLLAFVPAENLKLTTPKENVSTYTFNRHVIQHHFCAKCGIAPYGEGSDPKGNKMAAVNLRCIPAIDLETLTINKVDGRSF
ncbi:GFA family protein [Shinella sp. M31]|uniref:GFA family protein n=1 Tax=Shinella sp. M31 TaxID=3368615 RepID=UPI0028D7B9A3|nr:GFA family protein [uncultured Shinella sp.]